MKKIIITLLATIATTASASQYSYNTTAEVVRVEPLYSQRIVNKPVKSCYTEQVPVYSQRTYTEGSRTGDVIGGAILGGIVGHAIDATGGSGVGALLGGVIANESSRRDNSHVEQVITGYREVQRCNTTYQQETVTDFVDYRYYVLVGDQEVSFRSHHTYKLGDRVLMDVKVSPKYN